MTAIVACDTNYAIGKDNKLLFKIPNDIEFFKNETTNGVVLMGRKTFESLDCKPLPNRINIVVSTDKDLLNRHDIICIQLSDIDRYVKMFETAGDRVYCIGGGMLYRKLIDKCDNILMTKYSKSFEFPDTYFPNPIMHGFQFLERISDGEYNGFYYSIEKWSKP